MIICDRCGKRLGSGEDYHGTLGGDNDIQVCPDCYQIYQDGEIKIKDEINALKRERLDKWHAEWLKGGGKEPK